MNAFTTSRSHYVNHWVMETLPLKWDEEYNNKKNGKNNIVEKRIYSVSRCLPPREER